MKIFTFSGPDGGSDNGYYEVLVYAASIKEATKLVHKHFKKRCREDLSKSKGLELRDCQPIPDKGTVIHSTVEGK